MVKKNASFETTNKKGIPAKERARMKERAVMQIEEKRREDQSWLEHDKNILKKQLRKEEKELKHAQSIQRKNELKNKADSELNQFEKETKKQKPSLIPPRVTRAQIEDAQNLKGISGKISTSDMDHHHHHHHDHTVRKPNTSNVITQDHLIQENLNRSKTDNIVATDIDQAITALSETLENSTTKDSSFASENKEEYERNNGKRVAALFRAYKERELPRLRAQNPTLKFSQVNEILLKQWNKSPENPNNSK